MVLNSAWMFLVIMPVVVTLFVDHGLSMEQVFWLQSIFAGCIVLLEVPSGYLADLFGRRRSLILAGVFHGAAYTVLALADSFALFVCFEVLAALGNSFFSGSDVALLYDTEAALGERWQGTRTLGRRLLWAQVGETAAALLCGVLVVHGLGWPATVNAVVAWVPLLLAFGLVEPPRRRAGTDHRENIRSILRVLFRGDPTLRLTFIALVVYGLATLLAVWSFQDYWRSIGVPLAWFGVIWAAYNLTVALVGRVAHRLERGIGARAVIICIGLMPILGYGGMALGAGEGAGEAGRAGPLVLLFAVAAGLTFQVGRGLNQVVVKGAMNHRVPAELRATANSLSSLGVRVLFVGIGPAMGWGFDVRGYGPTFAWVTALFSLLLVLVALPLVLRIGAAAPDEETSRP
jgi:MFS family permease